MNVIFLGAPDAGKGTHAANLARALGVPTISTGEILRGAIKAQTPLGIQAKAYMDAGQLVPDDMVVDLVFDRIAQEDCQNGYILDGFPRTIGQAQALKRKGVEIHKVINLSVEDAKIVARMGGRRVCSGCGATYHVVYNQPQVADQCDACGAKLIIRTDDAPETVKNRLQVYAQQTAPLIDYYAAEGTLVTVEGQESLEDTSKLVLAAAGIQ